MLIGRMIFRAPGSDGAEDWQTNVKECNRFICPSSLHSHNHPARPPGSEWFWRWTDECNREKLARDGGKNNNFRRTGDTGDSDQWLTVRRASIQTKTELNNTLIMRLIPKLLFVAVVLAFDFRAPFNASGVMTASVTVAASASASAASSTTSATPTQGLCYYADALDELEKELGRSDATFITRHETRPTHQYPHHRHLDQHTQRKIYRREAPLPCTKQ